MTKEHMNRAKSWCFDNGVTEEKIKSAWDNALETNPIIQNLNNHGQSWWWLPPHLLKQLIDRYSLRDEQTNSNNKDKRSLN